LGFLLAALIKSVTAQFAGKSFEAEKENKALAKLVNEFSV
jgi:hypothetical protein